MTLFGKASAVLTASSLLLAFASTAEARSFRVNDVPNGQSFDCKTCHTSNNGGGLNVFGTATQTYLVGSGSKSSKHTDWASLCPLDSDGDGFTNGEELGDPNCVWARGDANPSAAQITNPGVASSKPSAVCGNGKVEGTEQCDGSALNGASCQSLGLGTGTVSCTSNCTFDTSYCMEDSSSSSTGEGTTTSVTTGEGTTGAGTTTTGAETTTVGVTTGAGGASGAGGSTADGFGGTASATNKSGTPPPILPLGCSVFEGAPGWDSGALLAGVVGIAALTRFRRRKS